VLTLHLKKLWQWKTSEEVRDVVRKCKTVSHFRAVRRVNKALRLYFITSPFSTCHARLNGQPGKLHKSLQVEL
jgi:hypothetical protein